MGKAYVFVCSFLGGHVRCLGLGISVGFSSYVMYSF
jgi:hypothetical protein